MMHGFGRFDGFIYNPVHLCNADAYRQDGMDMNDTNELCACQGPDREKGSEDDHNVWDGSGD